MKTPIMTFLILDLRFLIANRSCQWSQTRRHGPAVLSGGQSKFGGGQSQGRVFPHGQYAIPLDMSGAAKRHLSTHFSAVRGLISRRLGRFGRNISQARARPILAQEGGPGNEMGNVRARRPNQPAGRGCYPRNGGTRRISTRKDAWRRLIIFSGAPRRARGRVL